MKLADWIARILNHDFFLNPTQIWRKRQGILVSSEEFAQLEAAFRKEQKPNEALKAAFRKPRATEGER